MGSTLGLLVVLSSCEAGSGDDDDASSDDDDSVGDDDDSVGDDDDSSVGDDDDSSVGDDDDSSVGDDDDSSSGDDDDSSSGDDDDASAGDDDDSSAGDDDDSGNSGPGPCASPDLADYPEATACGQTVVYGGALYECITQYYSPGDCNTLPGLWLCQDVAPDNNPWGPSAWAYIQACP